jgi:hypothetical protein
MEPIILPVCDTSDPASLEAFFGNYGYADHFRKVVLSNCAEIIRAEATEKISEARIDQLAHIHPLYVDFLIQSLNGRRLREQNVRESIVSGGVRA